MNLSLPLLSALALSSSLLALQPQEAKAMTIAFVCFERSSEKLVARSALDITSTSISCLPVPGTIIAEDSSIGSVGEDILVDNVIPEDDDWEDNGWGENDADDIADENDSVEDDGATYPESSTGSQFADAMGQHLGKLIGQGLADLFR